MVGLRSLRSLVPPYDNRPVWTLQFSYSSSEVGLTEAENVGRMGGSSCLAASPPRGLAILLRKVFGCRRVARASY